MRGATEVIKICLKRCKISTHAPHARRDVELATLLQRYAHFYSRASCEARPASCQNWTGSFPISTHAPHARRDSMFHRIARPTPAISTHAPHARRDKFVHPFDDAFYISTHAPHARRDGRHLPYWSMAAISTHAPHARRDSYVSLIWVLQYDFYSRASCEARHEHRKNCRDY